MKKIFFGVALLAVVSMAVQAQAPNKLSARGRVAAKSSAIAPDSLVSAYVTLDSDVSLEVLENAGAKVSFQAGNIVTVRCPLALLQSIAELPGVNYVQVAAPAAQMLDVARPEVGGEKVRRGETLSQPYTGKGVIVGIVDAGFDYAHSAFRDAEGQLRIKRVWEQSPQPTGSFSPPEKFGYGVELKTPDEIKAAAGDIVNNSHGTHVAAIAAGSDAFIDGALLGMAPESEIVMVSMGEASRDNVNISNALAYIFDYADMVGKPCVVNLSLGAQSGPHDGSSTFDVIADALQRPGRLIVGAAGNHRADKFHVSRQFASANDAPLATFIDFKNGVSTNKVGGNIEVWADGSLDFEAYLLVYNTSKNEEAERVKIYPSQEQSTVGLGRNITGNVEIATEDSSPLNGKKHLLLTSGIKGIRTNYAVALEIVPKGAGKVDIWADNTFLGLTDRGIDGFAQPSGSTIAEIGGTAKRILTVGAYTTRKDYCLFNETAVRSLEETVGEISSFSSCGPTADGRIKPQVTAPGCFISSAVSSNDNSGTLLISQVNIEDDRNNMYGFMQGTSMSAPVVTGIVATWLQAYPDLSPEELVEVVAATARQDQYTGNLSQPNNDWGYGKIDALAGIKECLARSGASLGVVPSLDAQVTLSDGTIGITFASSCQNAQAFVITPAGATIASINIGKVEPGATERIDVSGLQPGIYLLQVKSDDAVRTLKFALKQ